MMTINLILLILLGTNADDPPQPRVVGGEVAKPGQFPFAAAIWKPNRHHCTGSIISKRWILTAAHCFVLTTPFTIILGTISPAVGGTKYTSIETIPHEEYNSSNLHNDIGLVKTDREIKFDNFTQPITMASVKGGTKVFAMGWGATKGPRGAQYLMFIESTVTDQEKCKALAKKYKAVFKRTHLCILEVEGRGMCFGDSGGPLVADGKQVGIISYGLKGCATGRPDFFTRTASYSSWINKHAAECTRF